MQSIYQETQVAGAEIIELGEQHLESILEIERQGHSHPWSQAVLRDCFRDDYRLWGVEVAGTLAGYCVVACLYDEAHLLNLCIGRRYRKSGLARRLLGHLVLHAAHEGKTRLILEVRMGNSPAIQLYRSEGFTRIGIRPDYYPDGSGREDAIVMELPLGSR